MRKRINIRQRKFSLLMGYIMKENTCTWSQAKSIYKRGRIERAIAREFKRIMS